MHADRLNELGTKNVLRPDIYDSVDFWRGFCDGDGCVSAWVSGSYRYAALSFCGTYEDMTRLCEWVSKTFGFESTISKAKSIFQVKWSGKKAKQIITYLYKDRYSANIIKSEKAKEWFNA